MPEDVSTATTRRLDPIGAEIEGLDLRAPISEESFRWLRETVMPTLNLIGDRLGCSFDAALRYLMGFFAESRRALPSTKRNLLHGLEELVRQRPPEVYFA